MEKGDFRTVYRIKIDLLVPELFNFKDIKYKNGIKYIYVRVSCGLSGARTTNL